MKKTLLAFLMLCPFLVNGQAFMVNLQGQRQIGMGHAGVALNPDAASIYFNPGAVSHLEKNTVSAGISPIFSSIAYRESAASNYRATTDNPMGTPFNVYGAFGAKEGGLSKFKFGIGVYTPFGNTVKWGDDWRGDYVLQQLSLKAIFIQPTISYKISDKIGIGVGFVYATGSVNLQRAIYFPIAFPDVTKGKGELNGAASGMGFNAGIYIKPSEKVSIGISYRSQVNMNVKDGDAKFTVPAILNASFPTGNKFNSTLPLPQVASIGVAIYPSEKLTLSFEGNFSGWSAYDSLKFDYVNNTPTLQDTKSARMYKNSLSFRGGAEYKATEALKLRGGMYYSMSPVEDTYLTPETPDADRIGVSVGVGYSITENFSVDASFLWVEGMQRTDYNPRDLFGGIFKSRAFVPGISLSYSF